MILSRSISIVGATGTGKSTVGKQLAKLLDVEFADLDEVIEQELKRNLGEFIKEAGEKAFRGVEFKALKKLLQRKPLVIVLGAGALSCQKTRELATQATVLVSILASESVAADRIIAAEKEARKRGVEVLRPMVFTQNLSLESKGLKQRVEQRIRELYELRKSGYLLAKISVINENLTPIEAAERIVSELSLQVG